MIRDVDSNRTSRLARRLFGSDREGVYYDIQEKKRYHFKKRGKALEKYGGRDDVFVSFTSLPKLGINPKSRYNTPLGIYSYPVDYVLARFYGDNFRVPFAGGSPYVQVFSVSNLDKILLFIRSDTSLVSDDEKFDPKDMVLTPERVKKLVDCVAAIEAFIRKTYTEFLNLWVKTYKYEYDVYDKIDKWYPGWHSRLLKETGLGEFPEELQREILHDGDISIDTLKNIHASYMDPMDLRQLFGANRAIPLAIKFMGSYYGAREVGFPYEDILKSTPFMRGMDEESYIKIKTESIKSDQRIHCNTGLIWNLTRHLTGIPVKWASLLKQMGFIGARDYGTGTIYQAEPVQAVFFDRQNITQLDVIYNKEPKQFGQLYNREYSEWAEDPESNTRHIYMKILNTLKFLTSIKNSVLSPDLMDENISINARNVVKLISWLSQYGTEDVWNKSTRDRLIISLSEYLDIGPKTKFIMTKTIRVIQRGR